MAFLKRFARGALEVTGGFAGGVLGAVGGIAAGAIAGPVGSFAAGSAGMVGGGTGGLEAGIALGNALFGEEDPQPQPGPEHEPERGSVFSPQKNTITNKESATLGRNNKDGYQLKFEAGSLPPGIEKVELTVKIEISDQIQAVPKGEAVVSGFYSFEISTLTPLEKYATFTIQHCSRGANPNHIRVIRAESGTSNRSYVARDRVEIRGSVAIVKLWELASYAYAVVCDWASSWMSISYCGILYRLEKEGELADSCCFRFVVIRDLSLHITAIEEVQKDKWKDVSRAIEPMPLSFAPATAGSERKVALDLTRDGIATESGWKIKANTLPAEIWEEEVKKFNPKKLSIPMCELNASSTNVIPERLEAYVDLHGSTKPKQILLQYTPGPRGDKKQYSYRNGPNMEDHRLESDDGLRYIAEEIGDKYLDVGTFLLNDVDGSKMAKLMDETKRDPYWISYKVFQKWVNGEGIKPVTWNCLMEVLTLFHLTPLVEYIKTHFIATERPDHHLLQRVHAMDPFQSLKVKSRHDIYNILDIHMQSIICFGRNRIDLRKRIGVRWRDFGTFILNDDTGSMMANLREKYQSDAEKINHEIFSRWLRGEGRRPISWETLTNVLKEIQLNTLADEINAERPNPNTCCVM